MRHFLGTLRNAQGRLSRSPSSIARSQLTLGVLAGLLRHKLTCPRTRYAQAGLRIDLGLPPSLEILAYSLYTSAPASASSPPYAYRLSRLEGAVSRLCEAFQSPRGAFTAWNIEYRQCSCSPVALSRRPLRVRENHAPSELQAPARPPARDELTLRQRVPPSISPNTRSLASDSPMLDLLRFADISTLLTLRTTRPLRQTPHLRP